MPLVANATQLTVSTWFFSRTKDNAYHRISDGIDQEKYQLALWAGDIINWSVKTSGGVRTSSVPSTAWSAGQWNFIVGTYDGIATKVYLNGQLADSDTWNEALNIPTTGTTRIGSSFQSLQFFNGLIDNFRIYNYARTPAQIAWEYNKGKPVGWWRFNECTGSTVHDESGNGNNGTINLGASGQTTAGTCTANANTPWYNGRTGKYNASLNFDGTDDYVDMGTVPTFTNNVVSESTWFYRRSNSSDYECIVSIGNSGTESYGAYSICSMADGKIRAHAEYSYSMYIESDNVVSNNVWHNAAMVSDGSNYYLYIDGVRQKASRPSSNPVANFFRIGGSVMSAEYFDGQIDDVKIFNYALTADQVKTLYNDASAVNFGN